MLLWYSWRRRRQRVKTDSRIVGVMYGALFARSWENWTRVASDTIIIVVSNPVDVLTRNRYWNSSELENQSDLEFKEPF